MKKILFCSLFLFIISSLVAQNHLVDSLLYVLKTQKDDTVKVNILNSLSRKFYLTGNDKTADSFAEKALQIAIKLDFKKGSGMAYKNIGNVYEDQGNYPQALKAQLEALQLFKDINYKMGMGNAYMNSGNIYKDEGDYPEALKAQLHALQLFSELGVKPAIGAVYGNIGNIYFDQGNYPDALKNYLSVLKTAKEMDDEYSMAIAYQNIGNIDYKQKNYAEALKMQLEALRIDEKIDNKQGIGMAYVSIGNIYDGQTNYKEAMSAQLQARKIFSEIADTMGIEYACTNIGAILTKQKKYSAAKQYLNSALALSQNKDDKSGTRDIYREKTILDSSVDNYKAAFVDYKNYIIYKNKIDNEENTKKFVSEQMQYEFAQQHAAEKDAQDKENALAAAASKRQKIIILLIASIAISLALALFNIFNSLKTTRKQKLLVEKQKVLVELQALRAQMNPHFIFNAINSIKQFIFENDSEAADRHLSRFTSLIRKVLENSKQENIPLAEEIRMLELYIQLEMLRFAGKFSYKIIVGEDVNSEKVLISPLIIQPYVENAIWHGLMHRETHGELILKFEKSDDMLKCTIDDNGIGRKRSAEIKKEKQHKSMGLSITKERLEIINMLNQSKMSIHFTDKMNKDGSPGGTRVELFVPYTLTESLYA